MHLRAAALVAMLCAVAAARTANAQDAGVDAGVEASADAQEAAAPSQFDPPKPLFEPAVAYPANAPPHTEPIVVRVKLLVGPDGLVQKVELLTHSIPEFDDAVALAARSFRFEPGRYQGKPVPVEITFSHTFLPPPPAPTQEPQGGPSLSSVLRGRLVELGTRRPVAHATVAARLGDRVYSAESDPQGQFRLPVPAGPARVTVHALGHHAFLQTEQLAPQQELAVTYYIERERYDPYEIVVIGEERREEASRVTLRGPELKQVPGTFGDPFRVIQALPGVASIVSLLPFPVVRGASPGSTGFLIDGTRVPLLYHLLSGPSVIYPELVEEVQFFPGGAPVIYGGYTAGIVDGRTRRARKDESLIDLDANLLLAGGLVREPVPFLGATVTAAARIGYPGLLLSLATDQASLSYWDYQLRLDGGTPRNGWTIFAFGARDEVDTVAPKADPNAPNPPLVPGLVLGFHRLDLRLYHGSGRTDGTYRLVAGFDETTSSGSDISAFVLEPRVRWHFRQSEALELVFGVEGSFHDTSQGTSQTATSDLGLNLTNFTEDLSKQYAGSALTEALWRPGRRWLIRPGVRTDAYYDTHTNQAGVDPRLTLRYRLTDRHLPDVPPAADESGVWLRGSVGLYHQPPRFFLPLPGLDTMPLKYGLLTAMQYDLGIEVPLRDKLGLTADAFYNDMNPVVFDLQVNSQNVGRLPNGSLIPTSTTPPESNAQMTLDRLLMPQIGRAYGFELLLRREAKNGLYGWLAYTLSLSERQRDSAWVPFDFDRTHIINLVGGVPLARNWDLGMRLQYQSGRPATTTYGYNTAHTDGYFRVDVRVDKRAVWKKWLLDFYIDITNVALLPEEITPGTTIRYVLPTFGLRGRL